MFPLSQVRLRWNHRIAPCFWKKSTNQWGNCNWIAQWIWSVESASCLGLAASCSMQQPEPGGSSEPRTVGAQDGGRSAGASAVLAPAGGRRRAVAQAPGTSRHSRASSSTAPCPPRRPRRRREARGGAGGGGRRSPRGRCGQGQGGRTVGT